MTHKATVGSISHGTLKIDDLLEAFGWELQHIEGATAEHLALANEARQLAHAYTFADSDETEDEADRANDLVDKLTEALNELAPAYCYFSAHEGDGSDFGFWPSMEAIEELPRVSDPSEVEKHLGEDCAFVNDHGNVTVYSANGAVILELV